MHVSEKRLGTLTYTHICACVIKPKHPGTGEHCPPPPPQGLRKAIFQPRVPSEGHTVPLPTHREWPSLRAKFIIIILISSLVSAVAVAKENTKA